MRWARSRLPSEYGTHFPGATCPLAQGPSHETDTDWPTATKQQDKNQVAAMLTLSLSCFFPVSWLSLKKSVTIQILSSRSQDVPSLVAAYDIFSALFSASHSVACCCWHPFHTDKPFAYPVFSASCVDMWAS